MKKTIFLSGPMRGIPRAEGLLWRNEAKKLLSVNFNIKHAYRGREEKETFADPRSAVIRDKYDVIHSDVLIVNDLSSTASMIGTSMEILLAFQNSIPVFIFGEGHKGDYFLDYHSHGRFSTLEEVCDMVNKMFVY